MASTSGHALGSRETCKQLHDDSNSSSEITQDSDIDITEHSDHDAKINKPDLGDSGGNSDDSQVSAVVSNDDNENWALWGKTTTIRVRYHFVHLVVNRLGMPDSPYNFFFYF
jgi:hypothetical protein